MLEGQRILAVVPARGGSKGVPRKNIHPLGGMPLIAWTGKTITHLPWIDRAVVSTDSDEIAAVATKHGIAAPFRRPDSIAGDRIGDWDVLVHALGEMEKQDSVRYDIVLMLQPTCPLRKPAHVEATTRKLINENWDAVWTVSETESKGHPLKQFNVGSEGGLSYYDPAGKAIIARQQLKPVYHRNGAAYAIRRECLLDQKSIFGTRPAAIIVADPLANIDSLEDFAWAEWLLERKPELRLGT